MDTKRLAKSLRKHNAFSAVLGSFLILAALCGMAHAKGNTMNAQTQEKKQMRSERFERGWEKLKEVDGHAGEAVVEALKDVAPDLGDYIIEYGFGDIYSRPGLTLKEREIATVAALTALGNAAPQLKVHVHAALNVGCTKEEIVEVIIQMSAYAGFPAALNGVFAAKEVFIERGLIDAGS